MLAGVRFYALKEFSPKLQIVPTLIAKEIIIGVSYNALNIHHFHEILNRSGAV